MTYYLINFRALVVCSVVAFCLGLSVILPSFAGPSLTAAEKAALQAAMQRHIDRQLVKGAFLQVDFATGAVRRLHPKSAHPMILHLGKFFVLCSDFRDKDGGAVNIDFYIARNGKSHTVFQTVVDNRKPLERLIKSGKATVAR